MHTSNWSPASAWTRTCATRATPTKSAGSGARYEGSNVRRRDQCQCQYFKSDPHPLVHFCASPCGALLDAHCSLWHSYLISLQASVGHYCLPVLCASPIEISSGILHRPIAASKTFLGWHNMQQLGPSILSGLWAFSSIVFAFFPKSFAQGVAR